MQPRLAVVSVLAAALAATGFLAASPEVQAQKGNSFTDRSRVMRGGGGGADRNIKTEMPKNTRQGVGTPPAEKGGTKTRGGSSTFVIDNRTGWYISVYVNGRFSATVGPYGNVSGYANPGSYALYARANFDDGSFRAWGPRVVQMTSGVRTTWTLSR
uniref:Secreted protein n=1 Tax=uncultured Armatimonadetes bacterium TaxID=157466 RepID=A0A6J4JN29_9BACT|nr:hypothetical protein AVDCRST_MAG63-4070 [uncultured Armatimonadetes bacterium]